MILRLGASLDQFVIGERVEALDIPGGVVAVKFAIAPTQRQPASVVYAREVGVKPRWIFQEDRFKTANDPLCFIWLRCLDYLGLLDR